MAMAFQTCVEPFALNPFRFDCMCVFLQNLLEKINRASVGSVKGGEWQHPQRIYSRKVALVGVQTFCDPSLFALGSRALLLLLRTTYGVGMGALSVSQYHGTGRVARTRQNGEHAHSRRPSVSGALSRKRASHEVRSVPPR